VRILEVRETPKNYFMFLEYMEGGDLFNRILKPRSYQLDVELTVKALFYQIASAVFYLHEKNIAHRDIKVKYQD
jgi:serine/threonine protein kinase